MSDPHPVLIPYLEKHQITWEELTQTPKGRTKKTDLRSVEIRKLKSDLITDLHSSGFSWVEMSTMVGKTVRFIQKYTKYKWSDGMKEKRGVLMRVNAENGDEIKRRTKIGKYTKKKWEEGKFDFHKNRIRSDEEIARQKASYTPEVRAKMSEAKIKYIKTLDVLYCHGIRSWVTSSKCIIPRVHVRSSYEKIAIGILDADDIVVSFEYEPSFILPNGKRILPDFLVTYKSGSKALIEIKASWQLKINKSIERLELARQIALANNWDFQVWTERDKLHDFIQ
jgi:hypothetical protein